jgi:hypothetical protein
MDTCALCPFSSGGARGRLLCCGRCNLQIHELCCGESADESSTAFDVFNDVFDGPNDVMSSAAWLCAVCRSSAHAHPDSTTCVICCRPGGAFKRMRTQLTDLSPLPDLFVHIICAVYVPEVQFDEPKLLEGPDCGECDVVFRPATVFPRERITISQSRSYLTVFFLMCRQDSQNPISLPVQHLRSEARSSDPMQPLQVHGCLSPFLCPTGRC